MEATNIVNKILSHINKDTGKYYSDYYAGIAEDAEDRLFSDHNVDKTNGYWIYWPASNDDIAREAEKMLLAKGMKGGLGGGSQATKFVYCYRITSNTKE
ncbi:MAG: hypothetical protein N4A71_05500 [Carboxylicivirga sp.]|jgi:hypothetical protein|nr:hypothetical protein [Carboxylicivirga sp.]